MNKKINLLQKQGFYNSLILYAGVALGFFNLIILFNRYLTIEEIGFYTLLIAISGIFAQISSLGTSNIILRYYPYYNNNERKDAGFVSFIVIFALIGFAIATLLFVVFKSPVIDYYKEKKGSSLLVKYYIYIVPVAFFTLAYTLLEALARTIFKNVFSAFLKEVLIRIITSLGVLLIAFKFANYQIFVAIFLFGNAVITFILWYSIHKSKQFKLNAITPDVSQKISEMVNYGLFAVLSGGSFALIQSVDTFALSALTNDGIVGIYGVFFGIAVVINLPAKALNRTSYQIISNAWKDNDLQKIGNIYHKTSLVQAIVGCLLFVGLISNHHNIILLLKKPVYEPYFSVFVIVGIAFLVDITGGLNSAIITSSKYYKLIMYLLATGVFICIGLNLILIPRMGMAGAAYAYLITMFALNFTYWLFIKLKFGLQPFNRSYISLIIISMVCLIIGLYLPVINNFLIDIIYRSGIIGVLYVSLVFWLGISTDINEFINKALQKTGLHNK